MSSITIIKKEKITNTETKKKSKANNIYFVFTPSDVVMLKAS